MPKPKHGVTVVYIYVGIGVLAGRRKEQGVAVIDLRDLLSEPRQGPQKPIACKLKASAGEAGEVVECQLVEPAGRTDTVGVWEKPQKFK